MESLFLSRNQEHELIMTCIYDALVYSNMGKEFSVEEIMTSVFGVEYDEISFFVKEMVIKSLAHVNEIKKVFQEKMPKWSFDRLNLVEQSILIMSYTHKQTQDVDKSIIINVAVKLAKKYLDKDDYKFVNGILDKVL
jgi:N utilization substance protein B